MATPTHVINTLGALSATTYCLIVLVHVETQKCWPIRSLHQKHGARSGVKKGSKGAHEARQAAFKSSAFTHSFPNHLIFMGKIRHLQQKWQIFSTNVKRL